MSLYIDIKKQLHSYPLHIQLEAGDEAIGILGRSGSGKSITLKMIAGIITPDAGEIVVNDRVLFHAQKKINVPPQQRNVGLLFQNYALFPHMTVAANIAIAIPNERKAQKKDVVTTYLDVLQIAELAHQYPHELSGGQQQRVALARMLAKNPDILLLDEPFSAIDMPLRHLLEEPFAELLDHFTGTVLYVSHSIEEVYRFCERTAIVSSGRIQETAPTAALFRAPTTVEGARLLGLRNIASVEITGEQRLFANEWGIHIDMQEPIPRDTTHIGIREEDIRIRTVQAGGLSFAIEVVQTRQTPFGSDVSFRPLNALPTSTSLLISRQMTNATEARVEMGDGSELYANIQCDAIRMLTS